MRPITAVLAVAIALAAAPAARAQPVSARSGPDTYLELHLGAFFPQAKDLDSLDPGVAFSGTFGAMVTPYLGAEATTGYYRAAGSALLFPGGPTVHASLGVIPILASLRLYAPIKTMELSARAGLGLHFATVHGTGLPDQSGTAVGYHLGGSAAVRLSPTMLVGLDLLGTFAEPRFAGSNTRIDGLTVAVKLEYRL